MSKYSSKGVLLQRDIASVFTTVAAIRRLTGPDGEVQFFDGTSLDSGVSMEDGELTGHTSPGEVSGELFYDPADSVQQLFTDDLTAGGVHVDWKTILPASQEMPFNGSTRRFTPTAAVGDGLMADFAIKLRSLATYPT